MSMVVRRFVDSLKCLQEGGGNMTCKCEVKEQSAQPTLSIRTRTLVQDIPDVLGKAYGAIAQYLGELQEQPA